MPNKHGEFIWYELMTADAEGAKRFYDDVVGWRVGPAHDEIGYRMIEAGDGQVGGVLPLGSEMIAGGARPGWLGYIGVDEVDEAVAKLQSLGGAVHAPPRDIPGVGRFAMVADPRGSAFYVMRGASEASSEAFSTKRDGHAMWNELTTSDLDAALDFYADLFGWEKGDAIPMGGEAGDYQFLNSGGETFGAAMEGSGDRPPGWTYCFRVPDIDEAHRRVSSAGGAPAHDPVQIPGGEWVFEARDPEGARFYLGGPRKEK
ncbi:MAG: VOC family protein [Sphingomonadaceae bacterium]|nr:VOC family protein [Sphingomonadaceae bacterium]